jgi:DNA adenine methylase
MSSPASAKPLLKWAGGKRQLLPTLSTFYPRAFDRYIEPFFGSGAVFFDLAARGLLEGRRARLADVNADLVGCYHVLRERVEDVIRALGALEREHRRRGAACYYAVRDRRFNPARLARRTADAAAHAYTPELAAMLIFLNRTGFNGLYRLNSRGEYNVPAGRYVDPRICDPDHLRRVAGVLAADAVTIEISPFDSTLADAGAGDFVYCDPPYAPLSKTASFAHYTAGGFTAFDQRRLQQAVIAACRRGAFVLLSNSSAPEILDLYRAVDAKRAGLTVTLVPARRAINSRASLRGPVNEVIVTNVPQATARERLDTIRPSMLPARVTRQRSAAAGGRLRARHPDQLLTAGARKR